MCIVILNFIEEMEVDLDEIVKIYKKMYNDDE